uniref:Uncharacterized protein n=1 Tax=Glycine max TaxID=3847 RepID=C6TNR4_SOYBN|nr:unknown [Glycine max]
MISPFDNDVPASANTLCSFTTTFDNFMGCLHHRWRHSNNNNAKSKTNPTTITIMAPVEKGGFASSRSRSRGKGFEKTCH